MATQVELAVSWAKSKLGVAAYSGRCQAFVADAYAYGAGMTRKSASTAKAARNLWRTSTSRSNIPVGAAVYFDSPTAPAAGHVGLYIGNNQVIHAFGKVKQMSVDAIIGAGYAYQGWGWNGGVKPTGAGSAASGVDGSGSADADPGVVHIPQTEQVWTVYETDTPYTPVDGYQYLWRSYETGTSRDITDRIGSPTLTDDTDSLCMELSFSVVQSSGDKYLKPLGISPGDHVAVINTGTQVTVFWGQIQSVSGSYQGSMSYTAQDGGRLLTCNEVILQFNNVPAKTALGTLASKLGLQISCPDLVSSVYDIVKDSAANVAQSILETVTAENGVPYFLRVKGGNTLVVQSYGASCIQGFSRQESNLAAFNVLDEVSSPTGSWDIQDLRNQVIVYSDADDAVSVLASEEDSASIKRYGRRTALETYSDTDTVSASSKAKTKLLQLNVVAEEFSLHCYGSDKIVAGCRVSLALDEVQGEFWVTQVTHHLGPPHTMDLTLRRAT